MCIINLAMVSGSGNDGTMEIPHLLVCVCSCREGGLGLQLEYLNALLIINQTTPYFISILVCHLLVTQYSLVTLNNFEVFV